jgi:hypothetical protein
MRLALKWTESNENNKAYYITGVYIKKVYTSPHNTQKLLGKNINTVNLGYNKLGHYKLTLNASFV